MYIEGVTDRIEHIKDKMGVKEGDLEYPSLTMASVITPEVAVETEQDELLKSVNRALEEIRIIETNR